MGTRAVQAAATRLGLAVALGASCLVAGPVARAQDECRGFSEQTVIDEGTNGVASILVLQLDGDADFDIVSASFGDDKLFWYENDESYPGRFEPHLISDRVRGAADVFAEDISGDGRPDLVAAAPNTNSVIWFEQSAGSPPLFTARTISATARLVMGVHAAKVDDDEHVDVLSASYLDNTIAWYEHVPAVQDDPERTNYAPPSFTKHVIDDEALGATAVFAADLDGDGDTDVLSASYLDDTIAWYRQEPAEVGAEAPTPSFEKQAIDTISGATAVVAHDLDGDGRVDVLAAAQTGNAVYWWPNVGGGSFGTRRTISDAAMGVLALAVADVNDDLVPDVLSANYLDSEIAWYESDCASLPCASLPSFAKRTVSTAALHAFDVAAGDLDGGGVDLVSASSVPGFPASQDKIAWYLDVASVTPPALPEERRIYRSADGAVAAFGADLDGDGDVDVATAGRTDRIAWYENDDAARPAFAERIVSLDAAGAVDVFAADLDGDADNDLVTASTDDDTIAWYENDGNEDPVFAKHIVSNQADEARDVLVTDLDADGFPDILSASSGDGKIAWYENDCAALPCAPTFVERAIAQDDPDADPPVETGARAVQVADVDGDEDLDVLAALYDDGRVRWYENPGNPAAPDAVWIEHDPLDLAGEEFVLLGASAVFGADLDGDGDTDILATAAVAGSVIWLESDGALPPVFTRRLLASDANEVSSIEVVEGGLDGDAFLDILVAVPGDGLIAWFESNGATPPVFGIDFLAAGTDFVMSTSVADVNGDALPDVVAGQRLAVSWFEASAEICATFDANGDGTIDGIDLSWIGRAFGMSTENADAWVVSADLNGDGTIDGDDLAYLAAVGVFGYTTTTCSFICR